MFARAVVAASLVACSGRLQPARQPSSALAAPSDAAPAAGGGPSAASPASPIGPWIRFEDRGTYFCVRLPDGQLRSTAYGVGGNKPNFVLHEGIELGHAERDALCTNYGITVLGARGQLGSTHKFHENARYTVEHVEPTARSLGVINLSRCWVDDAGKVDCLANTGRVPSVYIDLLNNAGPIDHLTPTAPCAVYRNGDVACVTENGQPLLIPLFTNARDASIVSHGWSQYAGCALLRTGKVACLGHNALALRSFTDTTRALTPVEIPGLDKVDEVTVGGATACARRGGDVWCWGETAARQAGMAAARASKAMPKCVVDAAATKRAHDAYEAAKKECEGRKRPTNPRQDDPLCRSVWGAIPPGNVFKPSDTPCDPYEGPSASRWAPPTKVDGIADAVAIGTNGRLSCAIRGARTLTCWGNEVDELRSVTFPARTIAAEPTPSRTRVVERRPLALQVGERAALVTSASGIYTRHDIVKGRPSAGTRLPNVIDALVQPACSLAHDGGVSCEGDPPSTTAFAFPSQRDGLRLSNEGVGCTLNAFGDLRCGDATTRGQGFVRYAAALAGAGPIVQHAGMSALYADGRVRTVVRDKYTTVVRWPKVKAFAGSSVKTCAILPDSRVECVDYYGKVTTVAGLPSAKALGVGATRACAVADDGSVWCWEDGKPAARITGIDDAIAVGVVSWADHACALTSASELACWTFQAPRVQRVKTKID